MSDGTPPKPRPPVTRPPASGRSPEPRELAHLLQFFYQCPVGLFQLDDDGTVRMVNPAAVSLLAPVIGGGDLASVFPLLRRLAPELADLITADPGRLGPLTAGRRVLVPIGASRDACLEMQAVRVAPNQVMIVVQDVTAERRLALREREIAVELQLAMLGRADDVPGLSVGVTYRAADAELEVGGDWYDVIALPDGKAGLVVGDIVGHDLSATGAMGQLRSALRATAQFRAEPAELLTLTDRLARRIDGAPSATLAYGLLDVASGLLRYASAGHPPMLVARADGSAGYLDGGRGLPLSILASSVPRTSGTCQLEPGDALIMFTDGLYERRSELPDERLRELVRVAAACRHLPPTELSRELTEAMLDDIPVQDDICVLVATLS